MAFSPREKYRQSQPSLLKMIRRGRWASFFRAAQLGHGHCRRFRVGANRLAPADVGTAATEVVTGAEPMPFSGLGAREP